ncbi:MAG: response regulator, partial [Methylococcaceae bacterium]
MTKILIVDDESKNLYLLQALLSSNGYELESASNGAEALELALRTTPDMIISDILMPVMDGFSLCRACKEDERLRDIPFIFYTATYTDPKDEALAFSLGAERFIIKPTEPAQFLALLKETVEKFATGKEAAQHGTVEDGEYYKKYNAVLIHKLEGKVAELEEKNRKLEADSQARKKAEEKIRQQTSRAEALVRTAFNINSKLDLNAVLSSICEETANALAAPAVSLRMVDPGNQTISVVADYGLPPILREKSGQIPLSVFPSQLSPASDTPVIIPDAKAVPQLPNADLFQLLNLCSIVSVKIKHKDTFIGSLSVFSVDNVRQFSEDEIALLEGLSNQAAQAITNAHL